MNLLGCLDRPSAGTYTYRGRDVGALDADALAEPRRRAFGFVFQQYNLIGNAAAPALIELSALHAGRGRTAHRARPQSPLVRPGRSDPAASRHSAPVSSESVRVSGGPQC